MKIPLCLATLCLVLAGCASVGESDQPIRAAHAEYDLGDGQVLSMDLVAAPAVLLRDGSVASTYRIDVTDPVAGTLYQLFLDSSFRLVRTDAPCAVRHETNCLLSQIHWGVAGGLPIFGLGLPLQTEKNGAVAYSIGPLNETWAITRNGHAWDVEGRTWPDELPGLLSPGTYTYQGSDVFPAAMKFNWNGRPIDGHRTELQEQGFLPTVVTQTQAFPFRAATGLGNLGVPSPEDAVMGQAETVQGIVDILRSNSSEARSALDSGACIGRMRIFPHQQQPANPLGVKEPLAEVQLAGPGAGVWIVVRNVGLLGTTYEVSPGQPRELPAACESIRAGPQPSITAAQFYAAATATQLHAGAQLQFVISATAHPSYLAVPAAGVARFAVNWSPVGAGSGEASTPITITLQPAQGWLERALIAPEDLASFHLA